MQSNNHYSAEAETGTRPAVSDRAREGPGKPGPKKSGLLGGGRGFGFVRARAVESWDGDAEETIVNSELRAVVDDVVEDESPDHGRTGHREDRFATLQ